jgi:hypothetical protein
MANLRSAEAGAIPITMNSLALQAGGQQPQSPDWHNKSSMYYQHYLWIF